MKLVCSFLSFWLVFFASYTSQSQNLTVIIKNIKYDKGNVGVALYNSDKDFMKNIYKSKSTRAKQGEVQLIFENIPPGTYAISVMHDANENGKMDSNLIGIPQEGFGFSNDAQGKFGPPGFEKAKFVCGGKDQVMVINLKYY